MEFNEKDLGHNTIHTNPSQESVVQYITFTVNDQEYGIEITTIREIKGWVDTTVLPNTPLYMRGVMNLRGAVVPILDLRCRFGLGLTETTKSHVVMIIKVSQRIMGILVDTVSDIINVHASDLKPIPSIDLSDHHETILQGIVNIENRMVAILSPERVFDQSIDFMDAAVVHKNIISAHQETPESEDEAEVSKATAVQKSPSKKTKK